MPYPCVRLSWIVRRAVGGVCVDHNYPQGVDGLNSNLVHMSMSMIRRNPKIIFQRYFFNTSFYITI